MPKPDLYNRARLEDINKYILEGIDKELINKQAQENIYSIISTNIDKYVLKDIDIIAA